MATTLIEWTRGADGSPGRVWNPSTGCDKTSPGCDNCYALTFAARLQAMEAANITKGRLDPADAKYQRDGDPRTSGPGFGIATHEHVLPLPLTWRKGVRIFVDSMSDLFHDGVRDEFIAKVWVVMALADQHTYLLLTKRHGRMQSLLSSTRWRELLRDADSWACGLDLPIPTQRFLAVRAWIHGDGDWSKPVTPLPHVWLGVSVEDQKRAELRVPALITTPAGGRWISAEPLKDEVDLSPWMPAGTARWQCGGCRRFFAGEHRDTCPTCGRVGYWSGSHAGNGRPNGQPLGWVVAGGESGGPQTQPMDPTWLRALRDQCQAAGVPFQVKQWGDWKPVGHGIGVFRAPERLVGPELDGMGHRQIMRWVGKKAAGRELDGVVHDAYPASFDASEVAR
jgi:protein gp37